MPEQSQPSQLKVAICVATFKRRKLLRRLLIGVSRLDFRKLPVPEITVIVVDNDVSRSAEEVCAEIQLPWPKKYVVESQRGLANVRNRAVFEAGNPDFIAFLDDDEVPTPFWLDELLSTYFKFDADVVAGPVFADYAPDVPNWVVGGDFFVRATFPTGHSMDKCSSNNVLIRRVVFDRVSSFSDNFELTGAEDTEFFMRVRRAGFKIVWANDAIVHEAISATRANFGWLLRRSYRLGNSWSLCELSVDGSFRTGLIRLLKGSARMVKGLAMVLISPILGKSGFVRALQTIWHGAGELSGIAGHRYQEYQSAGMDSVEEIPELG